jgi:hypothetical protein
MKYFLPLLCCTILNVLGCNDNNTTAQEMNEDYIRFKSKFDQSFISQFPEKLSSDIAFTIANTSIRKNSIGLFLYEYEISLDILDSTEKALNLEKIQKYRSTDTCLLIVNRLETKYTAENGIIPASNDSVIIERKCYTNQYPVPNFINYAGENSTQCGLDGTFDIYVLEAKTGRYSEKYDVKPFLQMPLKWANGYSKGIAMSREKRTIIYWSIIW